MSSPKEQVAIIQLLAEDNEIIPYRKSLRNITGGVTSTILLGQVIYWSKKQNFKPFYKFRAPCKHKLYQAGDSWTEELGFSGSEFDTAISKIGTKVVSGKSKTEAYRKTDITGLIIYWTDASRVTWYDLNTELLGNLTMSNYLVIQESAISRKSNNVELPLTETTTETTTEINTPADYLSHIHQASKNGTSEQTAPNPDDQFWQYRDKFLSLFQEKAGRYPNADEKIAIIELSNQEGASPETWETSLTECNLNWSGNGRCPLTRIIAIYKAGGSWEKWKQAQYPHKNGNGRHPPEQSPETGQQIRAAIRQIQGRARNGHS